MALHVPQGVGDQPVTVVTLVTTLILKMNFVTSMRHQYQENGK